MTRRRVRQLSANVCGEAVHAALIAARPAGLGLAPLAQATGLSVHHARVGIGYVKEHMALSQRTPLTYRHGIGFALSTEVIDWIVYEKMAFAAELTRVERLLSATVAPHAAKLPDDEYAAVVCDNLQAVRTAIRNLLKGLGVPVEALRRGPGERARLTARTCGSEVQRALLEARPAGMHSKQLVAATSLTPNQVKRGVLYLREVLALEGRTPLVYSPKDGYALSYEVLDWIVYERGAFTTLLRRIERLLSATVQPHAAALPEDQIAATILEDVLAVRVSIKNLLREVEARR